MRKFVNPSIHASGLVVGIGFGIGRGLTGHVVAPFGPARQVFIPAAFTAEGPPALVHRTLPAQDARMRLAHPTHSNLADSR